MLRSWSLFGHIHFPVGFFGSDLECHRQSAVNSQLQLLDPREGVQHRFAQIRIGLELARRTVTSLRTCKRTCNKEFLDLSNQDYFL